MSLILSAVLTLSTTISTAGATSNGTINGLFAQLSSVSLQEDRETQNQKVPFEIDDSEIEGATIISAGLFGEEIPLNGAVSGSFVLPEGLSADNPVITVELSGPEKGLVAEDVLVWKQKEALFFNGGNTARAEVILGLVAFGSTGNRLAEAYDKIGNHPKFDQLKQLMLKEKGFPDNDALLDRIADLTVEIAVDSLRTQ